MRPTTTEGISIEVHLGSGEWASALRSDVAAGLTGHPKELAPTWFYDERGCALFEAITELPEYYPTRAERSILLDRATEIATLTGADTLVELGSGTSEKTRLLLDGLAATGRLRRFVPFDVAEPTLRATAGAVAAEYPGIEVHGIVGDLRQHLAAIPPSRRRLVAFLGGTIGNFRPAARQQLLHRLAATMAPGDSFLLGTDLVKEPARLVAAYDDAAGVTAEFNRNVLRVLNRELAADFDLDAFDHEARFDTEHEWIEMHLRARTPQEVTVADLDLSLGFEAGETVRTEISAKFRRDRIASELAHAGLHMTQWWTDPAGDYALSLSTPAETSAP